MTTLYQLHDDLVELENRLDEMKAEDRQEEITLFINQWTETEGNLHDKIDNYAALIQELKSRAEMRKGEAKRLSDRAAVDLNKAKSLRNGLLNLFEIREIKKLDTKRFHLTRAKNGGKAPLIMDEVDPESLPTEFTVTTTSINYQAVRQTLEEGGELPFARLGDKGFSMRIK